MLGILRRRDFGLLWFAGLISITGDWMLFVALPIAVYELTGSAVATGGVLVANKIAALTLGSIAGVFVDRWDRKRTMVIANIVRATLLLPLLAMNSPGRVWIVYPVAAMLSAVGTFFRPAENALLPLLVDREELVPANALNALNDNLARLAGPALGGLVAAWIGLDGVILADAATYLIAAGMIGAIVAVTMPERAFTGPSETSSTTWRRMLSDWRSGLRLIWESSALKVVLGVFAISSLGEGVMQTAFWVFIDDVLGGGTREAGWLLSAQAVGGLIGAAVVGSWAKNRLPLALLGWGAVGVGILDILFFNYPRVIAGIGLGMLLMALAGLPATAFGTGYSASLQTEADDAYRGRVYGAFAAVSALFMIAGAAFAGVATERFGPVAVLTFDALGYAAGGVFALRALASGRLGVTSRRQASSP